MSSTPKIGDTLTALMVVNADSTRTIFAVMLLDTWHPLIFAERGVFDRVLQQLGPKLKQMKEEQGISFEVCTFTASEREPLA
jgi:hypothetical protein